MDRLKADSVGGEEIPDLIPTVGWRCSPLVFNKEDFLELIH